MNNKFVLADTCFWYALFTQGDQYNSSAIAIYKRMGMSNLVLPWPIFYEVVNTEFSKNVLGLAKFIKLLKIHNTIRLDDTKYRTGAFEEMAFNSLNKSRPLSLVDCVIREILKDSNNKIDYFITYNVKDFIDSIDWNRTELYK